jgi:hypothetical protein
MSDAIASNSKLSSKRRNLRFDRLQDVPTDVQTLIDRGHQTVGQWSLAQICNHLSTSIGYSLDGFPGRSAPWLFRQTLGRLLRRRMLTTGRILRGMPIPDRFQPPDTSNPREALTNLSTAIDRFLTSAAPLQPHPLFGPFRHDQWERFHCVHCAHHLSFAKIAPAS